MSAMIVAQPKRSEPTGHALIGSPPFRRFVTLFFGSPSWVFLRKPNYFAFPLLRAHPHWPATHPTSRSAV